MACLQMTNNSLRVTVKIHYLRCFDLFVCIASIVFRSFQHLFCTVIEMAIYPEFFIIWNDNLFIVFKYRLVPFGSISAVPWKGISNPPCTSGDPLWFSPMTLPQTITSLSKKKAFCSGNFPGQVTNCRVGKTASKALGRGNSIAIVIVVSLVAAFQLLSNNRTPSLFINVKLTETALKPIRDRLTVISARRIKIWCVFCSPQCGCSVAVHCIVTA